MKLSLIKFTLLVSFFLALPVCAQIVDLNVAYDFATSSRTVYLFSPSSNQNLKTIFPTNPLVKFVFSSVVGGPLRLAPTADSVEISQPTTVSTKGSYIIDYSMATQGVGFYGFSITPPTSDYTAYNLTVSPNATQISSSSSSGALASSSSSGGAGSSSSSSSGGISFNKTELTLSGPSALALQPSVINSASFIVNASGFNSISKCQVYTSNDPLLTIKPRKFFLSQEKDKQTIRISVPLVYVLELIKTNTSKTVVVNVTCGNKASDEIELEIKP